MLSVIEAQSRLQIPAWSAPTPAASASSSVASLVAAQVSSCLAQDLAVSTVSAYQSALNTVVGPAEEQLGTTFLPLLEEDKCMLLFGFLKTSSTGPLLWSRVRTLKAALAQWHNRHGMRSVFESWTPRLRAFWKA